ncbi:MAG: hypothetical protein QOJ15_3167 [Bradyrhizobium sp.]|jgi:hypothetical protein|nr:hypothetical protein [Bradyrhizobium sp.]
MVDLQTTAEAAPTKTRTEVIVEAKRIEEAALFSSKRHFEAARLWSWYHWTLGIPLVLLAALSGAAPAAVDALDRVLPVSSFIPLALLVLSALSTFVDAQKRMAAHQAAGNAYDALLNEVRIFRSIDCVAEPTQDAVITDRLKNFSSRKDKQNEMSPSTPWPAYLLAKVGIWTGQASYAVDNATVEKK